MPPADRSGRTQRLLANASLLTTSLVWGSFFPLLEQLLETWDPVTAAAVRLPLALPALLAILVVREGGGVFRAVPWRRVWLIGLGLAGFTLCITMGVGRAGAVPSAMIASSGPIIGAAMGWLMYRIPIGRGTALAAAMAVGGGALVTVGGASQADTALRGGEILMVLAVVLWLWHSLTAQRWLAGFSQLRIATLINLTASVLIVSAVAGAALAGLYQPRVDMSPRAIAIIVYIAITAVGMGNFFWHFGVSRLGVTIGTMYNNLIPVVALLVALALGAQPTWLQLAGGGLILGGVVYAQTRGRARRREAGDGASA